MGDSPEMMRCLICNYQLRGLPENRYPECGRAFDPTNSATYATKLADGRKMLKFALLGIAICCWPLPAVVIVCYLEDLPITPFHTISMIVIGPLLIVSMAAPLVGWLISAFVLNCGFSMLVKRRQYVEHRRCLWSAFLLSIFPVATPLVVLLLLGAWWLYGLFRS